MGTLPWRAFASINVYYGSGFSNAAVDLDNSKPSAVFTGTTRVRYMPSSAIGSITNQLCSGVSKRE